MSNTTEIDLKTFIRDIPDFPKPGILFRDITPLLASPVAFRETIHRMCEPFRDKRIDMIVGAEARGFIFAPPMAMAMDAGFVPVRKFGKLPGETHCFQYEMEYGEDSLEIHVDGIKQGQRVLVVDDLLATGGTVDACCNLIEKTGAEVVGCAFLIALKALGGTERIAPREVFALLDY
jgi:adenine phosphoribosyltransferase